MASAPFSRTRRFAACLTFLLSLWGCDDNESPSGKAPQQEKQLQVAGVPEKIRAEIYPLEGTSMPVPVAVVLADDPGFCVETRQVFEKAAHVVCSLEQSGEGAGHEAKLKEAVRFVKETYAAFTEGPPVFLVADEKQTPLAWKMMLKDPGFFGHAFLSGLDPAGVSGTKLSALHTQGAKTLVLQGESSKYLELHKKAASRGGLKVHNLDKSAEALTKGLVLLRVSDERTRSADSGSSGK